MAVSRALGFVVWCSHRLLPHTDWTLSYSYQELIMGIGLHSGPLTMFQNPELGNPRNQVSTMLRNNLDLGFLPEWNLSG